MTVFVFICWIRLLLHTSDLWCGTRFSFSRLHRFPRLWMILLREIFTWLERNPYPEPSLSTVYDLCELNQCRSEINKISTHETLATILAATSQIGMMIWHLRLWTVMEPELCSPLLFHIASGQPQLCFPTLRTTETSSCKRNNCLMNSFEHWPLRAVLSVATIRPQQNNKELCLVKFHCPEHYEQNGTTNN